VKEKRKLENRNNLLFMFFIFWTHLRILEKTRLGKRLRDGILLSKNLELNRFCRPPFDTLRAKKNPASSRDAEQQESR